MTEIQAFEFTRVSFPLLSGFLSLCLHVALGVPILVFRFFSFFNLIFFF